ncbi:hypothetical protein KJ940_07400 [Myxococcota bacterium]|nr:hypothetical protein [Myxococcota bacterium]
MAHDDLDEYGRGRRARTGASELILSVGEYAYTQDITSGIIKVHTGPTVVNITGQDIPVVYEPATRLFNRSSLDEARQQSPLAPQGHYCILWNPSEDAKHPEPRDKQVAPDLLMGQRVNIPGPCTFSLWPQQSAQVLEGHHLRSNQYLLVRIYDEKQARANWNQAVIKPAQGEGEDHIVELPLDMGVGQLIVIRGDRISFYIPPTGVEVVPEYNSEYVREALTLERLEYCILIDEDGNKRYERGPQVVFPHPSEHFFEEPARNGERARAFKPIELNEIQGLHVKVIADYEEGSRKYNEGEELFLTGKDISIYFPRQEHSLISYDGKSKHFATAVPAGEARYVMNRNSGTIRMSIGPTMLLPDPREEVIVRRVLTENQCRFWYPGNQEALEYNRQLREMARRAPTTRQGVVSEGEVGRSRKLSKHGQRMEASSVSSDTPAVLADEFTRGSTYTEPRTVTLDTQFSGVPSINLWTGYAVMVISRTGERRVELGPKTILLGYDESIEVLSMSTGKPKTTDKLVRTVYLRVKNNQVSDIIKAETSDHVNVSMAISMRVNFEGDPQQWFEVENYVKFLTDHVRSLMKGKIRQISIEDFYARSEDLIREILLGVKGESSHRPGLFFKENGMRVHDVEVLSVRVGDEHIAKLLNQAQHGAVESSIALGKAERDLQMMQRMEQIQRERALSEAETARSKATLEAETISRELTLRLARITSTVKERAEQLEAQKAADAVTDEASRAALAREQLERAQALRFEQEEALLRLKALEAETAAVVARFGAAQEGFSEAVLTLGNQETMVKVAEALSVQNMLGGANFVEVVGKVFEGTPFAGALEKATKKLK